MPAPLQIIALTFRLDADAESRLLAEVDRIEGRGVLRVLDMVFLAKDQDGTVEGLEVGDNEDFGSLLAGISSFRPQNADRSAAGNGEASDPGSAATAVRALAGSLEPGSAAAFLLVEHLWAGPLVDAVSAAGGALISDDFLAGDVSRAVGAEIAAVEEASAVIAEAQAVEAAAVLRAIAASAEAAEAEAASEQIQEAAAAEAVSALITAGLIEEAAVHEAVTALTTAGLITDAAAQAADEAFANAAVTITAADQATDEAVTEDLALIGAADAVAAEATRRPGPGCGPRRSPGRRPRSCATSRSRCRSRSSPTSWGSPGRRRRSAPCACTSGSACTAATRRSAALVSSGCSARDLTRPPCRSPKLAGRAGLAAAPADPEVPDAQGAALGR